LKLILKDVRVTGQSRYNSMMSLQTVKFNQDTSISELTSMLKSVQTRANRLKKDAIDDDIMKGALLSLAQGHPKYERLATDFSKPSSKLTYDETVDELTVHETNLIHKQSSSARGVANMTVETEQPSGMQELAALLSRAMTTSAKPKLGASTSTELCRDFGKGRCTKDPCRFSHAAPRGDSTAPSTDNKYGNRKRLTCYNCQKVGFHVASECTAPKTKSERGHVASTKNVPTTQLRCRVRRSSTWTAS
jgi:hypothetical protein